MKCPKCEQETLYSAYIRIEYPSEGGKRKRTNKAFGYMCINPECDYCIKSKPDDSGPEK
ncbi:hypothetical protein [Methanosarcina sp. UBA5]|uniref:hypothetical protein n=1 Tax=Methanosarcina sp. UBA5 TaxID=1915593 RepID=UPI0025DABE97|nr:hypothetical protein [Methanosarcina sp. UBA5]